MLSLPDTLQVLLTRFASMACRTALESTVLGLYDCLIVKVLAAQMKTFESFGYCTLINCVFTFHITNAIHLCGFQIIHGVKPCTMCQCTKYHYTTNERVHLLWAWTALVTWYIHCKSSRTKILQNFWLTLVLKNVLFIQDVGVSYKGSYFQIQVRTIILGFYRTFKNTKIKFWDQNCDSATIYVLDMILPKHYKIYKFWICFIYLKNFVSFSFLFFF